MGPSSGSRDQTRVHAISCATISRKDYGNSFLGLRRCSAFGIHVTQDNFYWRHLCFHNGGFLRENQTEKPWIVVGWFPAASWQCTRKQVTHIAGCYNHPPYGTDLAPCDNFLFRNLRKFLRGRRFPDDNAVKEAVTGYFNTQDVSYFLRVFDHWRRSGRSVLQSRGATLNHQN